MKRTIKTVSGHIGSGKSKYTLQWYFSLVAQNGGNPILATIATPTNKLSDQYAKYLTEAGIPCVVINQEQGYRSASEEYRRLCTESYQGVLLVNHFVALNAKRNTENRILILDEAISPLETIKIEFNDVTELDDFNFIEAAEAPDHYDLGADAKTIGILLDLHKDQDGKKYKTFGKKAKELAELIVNSNYRVVIDKASVEEAKAGKAFAEGKRVILQFTVFTLPLITDGYKDVLMISANFDETLCSLMWSSQVNFVSHTEIESRLDYPDMKHKSKLIELHHVPIKNLSGTFMTRLDKETTKREIGNQIFLDMTSAVIGQMFPDRPHIFCANKHPHDDKQYVWSLEGENGGSRVITNPHGWNDLEDCNMAVFAAGINFDPATVHRLQAFYGITNAQAKNALSHQMVYQFLGRTSARRKDSTEKVVLIAPDEGTAVFLQEMFGCKPSKPLPVHFEQPKRGRPAKAAKVSAPPAKRGRKRVERTPEEHRAHRNAQRAAQRANKKAAYSAPHTINNPLTALSGCNSIMERKCHLQN